MAVFVRFLGHIFNIISEHDVIMNDIMISSYIYVNVCVEALLRMLLRSLIGDEISLVNVGEFTGFSVVTASPDIITII